MRRIICADALQWMAETAEHGAVVTSLPDADEVKLPLPSWIGWFRRGVGLACELAHPNECAIFYQTDRKVDGRLVSKAHLVLEVASRRGMRVLWHKIVLRHQVGTKDLYRPGYTHMIAVTLTAPCGAALPDVIESGKMIYPNAMGLQAAQLAVAFAGRNSKTIIDPFCGRGTVPAVANAMGFDSIGIDIDAEQCAKAEVLRLDSVGGTIG